MLDVVLAPEFLDGVDRNARRLYGLLQSLVSKYPTVLSGVRGVGLILGLQCVVPNSDLLAAMRIQRLLAVTASDNVVRLVPPLVIGDSEIDEAVAKIDAACKSLGS